MDQPFCGASILQVLNKGLFIKIMYNIITDGNEVGQPAKCVIWRLDFNFCDDQIAMGMDHRVVPYFAILHIDSAANEWV